MLLSLQSDSLIWFNVEKCIMLRPGYNFSETVDRSIGSLLHVYSEDQYKVQGVESPALYFAKIKYNDKISMLIDSYRMCLIIGLCTLAKLFVQDIYKRYVNSSLSLLIPAI